MDGGFTFPFVAATPLGVTARWGATTPHFRPSLAQEFDID